ncbi:MAG TPA: NUDIX domain-containing protein [Bacillales bacterium]|nr:NUDIX domain-containing protein [Bacillales bacterium]
MEATWDGLPISKEKPYGTAIVVFKRIADEILFLILHRGHVGGENYDGDWAWGPPAGARLPGEPVEACMKRELAEETGLELKAALTDAGDENWYVYYAEAPPGAKVSLSEEHDQFEWLPSEKAGARCLPAFVGNQILHVADLVKHNQAPSE